ncbi:MAG: hypothetical protein ACR2KV_05880 [Solirubrobacteraceae bacterium]
MTPPHAAGAAPHRTAPARQPIGPRRVSGPARRPAPAPAAAPALRRLVDAPFLDRLIRGRAWIGLVAFALIGIVAMQVALLQLNAGIGRSVQKAATLEHANSALSAEVSKLQASDLSQAGAAGTGMVFAPPGDVRYLTVSSGDAARAAASMVPLAAARPSTATGTAAAGSSGTSGSAGGASAAGGTGQSSGPTPGGASAAGGIGTSSGSTAGG